MQLQVQAKSKTFAEPWELDAGRDELAAIARKADETGFFYVAVCDHVAIPKPLDDHMRTTWYETVATLGWLAGITSNVRLLSHVLVAAGSGPRRRRRRRPAPPGNAPRRAAGIDRLPARTPKGDPRRRADRHRHDHRDALRRQTGLGRRTAHAVRARRAPCRTPPRV